jgi:hypothetical protein
MTRTSREQKKRSRLKNGDGGTEEPSSGSGWSKTIEAATPLLLDHQMTRCQGRGEAVTNWCGPPRTGLMRYCSLPALSTVERLGCFTASMALSAPFDSMRTGSDDFPLSQQPCLLE